MLATQTISNASTMSDHMPGQLHPKLRHKKFSFPYDALSESAAKLSLQSNHESCDTIDSQAASRLSFPSIPEGQPLDLSMKSEYPQYSSDLTYQDDDATSDYHSGESQRSGSAGSFNDNYDYGPFSPVQNTWSSHDQDYIRQNDQYCLNMLPTNSDISHQSGHLRVKPLDSLRSPPYHEMFSPPPLNNMSYDNLPSLTPINSYDMPVMNSDSDELLRSSEPESRRRQRQSKAFYEQLTEEERKERHRHLDNMRSRQYRTRRRQQRSNLMEELEKEQQKSQELRCKFKQLEVTRETMLKLFRLLEVDKKLIAPNV